MNLVQQSTSQKFRKCSICRETGDGFHFGAEACRACAAFFRRSVFLRRTYVCRVNGKCRVGSNIRSMCRSCRFSKCLQVGMNPACVQHRSETILPSDQEENDASASMPILWKMRENYKKMESSRAVIHRREGESLIKPKIPRAITYKESSMILEKEMSLVVDWISCCFEDFVNLPCDQKHVLFKNFYMTFIMLQGAFSCQENDRDDVIFVASGDYIDLNNLADFYRDYENPEGPRMMSLDEVVTLFKLSFENFLASVIRPMFRLKIDVYEFFTLCTCALFDFGLTDQTERCVDVGNSVKERVLKELSFYLRKVKCVEDPSIRIAMLVTLLPSLNRTVKKFQEDVEISHVFNIHTLPEKLYKMYIANLFDTCIFK